MLQIPNLPGGVSWSEADISALRVYILSPAGQRFLARLQFMRPLVNTFEPEERRARQDARTGYEKCMEDILLLASSRRVTEEDREAQTLAPSDSPSLV